MLPYVMGYFGRNSNVHSYSSRQANLSYLPKCHAEPAKWFFKHIATAIWNQLKTSMHIEIKPLKQWLKLYLLSDPYCWFYVKTQNNWFHINWRFFEKCVMNMISMMIFILVHLIQQLLRVQPYICTPLIDNQVTICGGIIFGFNPICHCVNATWCTTMWCHYNATWCTTVWCHYNATWCTTVWCHYNATWCTTVWCHYNATWCTTVWCHYNATWCTTVWCHYNAVNFLANPYNRHPIVSPWGWSMGCLL